MVASRNTRHQSGLSLVELLVGLVIGLLATIVIMQVFSAFEGQRRTTSGTADAQTNGSLALMNIQRDMQSAGFGLSFPMADKENNLFKCNPLPGSYDPDDDAGTDNNIESLFPIEIQNGADDASDILIARTSTKPIGAVALRVTNVPDLDNIAVATNIGCEVDDIVLLSHGTACALSRVVGIDANPLDPRIDLADTGLAANIAPAVENARLTCIGKWLPEDKRELVSIRYQVINNQLLRDIGPPEEPKPIVDEIVSLQAQYGVVASADSNQVTQWVDPVDEWTPANLAANIDNRNRIRAVRVVVVARNGLREKELVTFPCETAKGTKNEGPCAWDDTDYDKAPRIDLSTISDDWQHYRYRTYETIIPLRNMLWSKDAL